MTTPYVVLIPDDDIVLPQAIAEANVFLEGHPDFVVAHGYFVAFCPQADTIDMHQMIGFTPSIIDEQPLPRLYELLRRYQSFYWGVLRTGIFRSAVTAARAMQVVVFRELTALSTTILQGKVARLRSVYALRGPVKSHAAIHQSHPFFFFLRDAPEFFGNYVLFRDGIAAFIRRTGIAIPQGAPLEQLLDLVYAAYLGREVNTGVINHAVQLLLGDTLPPIQPEPAPGWQEPAEGDVIHRSPANNRRYIWRRQVLDAEPRDETPSAAKIWRASSASWSIIGSAPCEHALTFEETSGGDRPVRQHRIDDCRRRGNLRPTRRDYPGYRAQRRGQGLRAGARPGHRRKRHHARDRFVTVSHCDLHARSPPCGIPRRRHARISRRYHHRQPDIHRGPLHAHLGEGTYVNAAVAIGGATTIGAFAFINRGSSIGHHVEIADFVSIGPGATIAGSVRIGRGAVIGAGAVILPAVEIGRNAVVSAGAVVRDAVADHCLVAGNPAQVVKTGYAGYRNLSV